MTQIKPHDVSQDFHPGLDADKVDGRDVEEILSTLNNKVPSSYALSTSRIGNTCKVITDWNNVIENGWFYSDIGVSNSPIDKLLIGSIISYNENWIIQELIDFTSDNWQRMDSIFKRMKRNGVWGTWKSELDIYYPIGERYIQLPEPDGTFSSAKSPEVKFGGEWVCVFDSEGVFFRTEGAEGQTRVDGLSESQIQDHKHWAAKVASVEDLLDTVGQKHAVATYSYYGNDNEYRLGRISGNANVGLVGYIEGTGSANSGDFTEPRNRLLKIWERIA